MRQFMPPIAVLVLTLTVAPLSAGQATKSTDRHATSGSSAPIVLAQGGAVRECPVDKNGNPYCGNNCPLCK